jgi:glycerol-3-phosphate cytidylyltransferase-like family protein
MLQARQLGTELLVGIHSDEAILDNKGPTVMTLKERLAYYTPHGLETLTLLTLGSQSECR